MNKILPLSPQLNKVAREVKGSGFNLTANGVVEILQYSDQKFLVLERSFTGQLMGMKLYNEHLEILNYNKQTNK